MESIAYNLDYAPLVLIMVVAAVASFAIAGLILPAIRPRRFFDPRERIEVGDWQEESIYIRGGELRPDFYAILMKHLSVNIRLREISIAFGPVLVIKMDRYRKFIYPYINRPPEAGNFQWMFCHPVLEYFYRANTSNSNLDPNMKKMRLYLKTVGNNNGESHYAVGLDDRQRNLCVEFPHPADKSGGGFFGNGNGRLHRERIKQFRELITNEDFCQEFTMDNANALFEKIEFRVIKKVTFNE
jgi:hypothetical protein